MCKCFPSSLLRASLCTALTDAGCIGLNLSREDQRPHGELTELIRCDCK